MRRTCLVLTGLIALALPATSYAGAAPEPASSTAIPARARVPVRTLEPMALRRGPDAAIDHLQDGVIRTASGRTVRVRVPHGLDQLALLGRSGIAAVHHPGIQQPAGRACAVVQPDRTGIHLDADRREQPVGHPQHRPAAQDAGEADDRGIGGT